MNIHYFDEITVVPTDKIVSKRTGKVFYTKRLKVNSEEGSFTLTLFASNKAKLAFKRGAS
tara:strand:- start:363 stop:542 length:180 start_codon:yes stop_codon:yes gene_type:complete